jgi:hypothetical protein
MARSTGTRGKPVFQRNVNPSSTSLRYLPPAGCGSARAHRPPTRSITRQARSILRRVCLAFRVSGDGAVMRMRKG